MVTISHIVKKYVGDRPFLEEALRSKILNYASLAEQLQPYIEQEMGKKVKYPAIMMALRRYSDEVKMRTPRQFHFNGEIVMKTNICDFTVVKSNPLLSKLNSIYKLVDYERGDTLNIIVGNNEVGIIMSERYSEKLGKFLAGEKIINRLKNLVSVTMIFSSKEFLETPGVIFTAARKLSWENVNIYEIVSTMTELTFIIDRKDSMKAYNALYELVSGQEKKN